MTGYSYVPAGKREWLAVATAGRLLVTRVDSTSDRVSRLAATGNPSTSVQEVLEVLTAQGLGATGPFALLFWVDGDLTGKGLGVIVRGEATVTVDTTDSQVTVSSRGVTTWSEQVIENPTGFTVTVEGSSSDGEAGLPLQQGAAWISRVRLDTDPTPGAPAGAAAEPVGTTPEPRQPPAEAARVQAPAHAAPPIHEETRVFHTTTSRGAVGTDGTDAAATEPEADGYDYLFGATVFRPIGAAAVSQPAEDDDAPSLPEPAFLSASTPEKPGQAPTSTLGDHDGRTMLASDILAARRTAAAPAGSSPPVLPQPGHRYLLKLPDGTVQALSAPVILGRAPSVSNVPASVLPHLVTLTGDDISRSHVRVAVEGDTVVVTDLHSSNGTHVIAPGKLPQLLRAGEPTPVIVGTAIDLGSDVLLHVTEA